MKKKSVVIFLKWIWLSAVVIFIFIFIYKKYPLICEIYTSIPFFNICLSFLILFFAKVLLTLFMYYSIICVNKKLSFWSCYCIYHTSQLAKYIPGNIWHLVSKGVMYKNHGFTLNDIKNAILVENILLVGSAFLFGIGILSLYNYHFLVQLILKYKVGFSIAAALVFLCFILFIIFFNSSTFMFFRNIKVRTSIKICFVQTCIWFSLGLNFYVIIEPFVPKSCTVLEIVGWFAVAYGLGYITPFAPAGMGVRESVLVFGLSPFLQYETIVIGAVFTRIIYVIVEIVLAASTIIFPKFLVLFNLVNSNREMGAGQ